LEFSLKRYFIAVILLLLVQGTLISQEVPVQQVYGRVVDRASQTPLPGANITILTTDPILGGSTDADGKFVINGVPTGRHDIRISYIGYQTLEFENQIISSGKALVINAELVEIPVMGREVEIIARQRKDQPLNPMALISARSFTIDETNRYAGSYGDPARMAANYAGVVSSRDNRNDIVIRGNSPFSLKYHIDGMEVLNPNHFGATGTAGGPVTILNSNLLANSDFYTGAFPAEYGNALSGIFDLRLRNGTDMNREYWGQLGFNGLEFGMEGPFKRGSPSTYLAAYRYSFTSVLEAMGVKLNESAAYQDLSFKLHFPAGKKGVFELTGLGGRSLIGLTESDKPQDKWLFPEHGEDLHTKSLFGAGSISHLYFFNEKTRLRSRISYNIFGIETKIDTFELPTPVPYRWAGENSMQQIVTGAVGLTRKIDARNSFDAGISYDLMMVSFADSQYYHGYYRYYTDARYNMGLLKAYSGFQHHFGPKVSSTIGLHFQYFTLNGSFSAEPRLGLRWNATATSAFSAGFGMHSQMVPAMLYFTQALADKGGYTRTDTGLDFMRSLHAVAGYDYLLGEHMRFKAEGYYQYLYNAPVREGIPQYSVLNEGIEYYVFRYDSLVSLGSGMNYGIDLTLERFLHRNYYFLFTASLFRSYYFGYDNVKRSTVFDNRYVLNAVGGYELPVGEFKNRFLVFGLRATWTGGRPYVPFDVDQTVAEGQVVYDWENAYRERFQDYIRGSLRLGFRRNVPNANIMLLIDLQYRSNYTYVDLYRIDVKTGEIVSGHRMGFYPMATWRIQF